jgi:hypothetical protein
MNPIGAAVLGAFGALWCGMGLAAWRGGVDAIVLSPAIVAIAIIFAAVEVSRRAAPRDPAVARRVQRVVAIASTVEGVSIFLAANVLMNIGRPDLVMPAMAAIVGLHFIPIAHAGGRPAFLYVLMALMLALAGASLLLPPTAIRTMVVGFGGALLLWGAAGLALARFWRAAPTASPG